MGKNFLGFIVAVVLSISSTSQAGIIEDCKLVEKAAQDMMEIRQKGIPLSFVMERVGDNKLIKAIAMGAYEYPVANDYDKLRRELIEDFKNEWYLMCLKSGES